MVMTFSTMATVFVSVVNKVEISVFRVVRITNTIMVKNTLKAIVSLEYFLALSIFP